MTTVTGLSSAELGDDPTVETRWGMTPVTCPRNRGAPTMLTSMTLSSLLVCVDDASMQVLKHVLEELGIHVESCSDPVRASVRLAQEHFDLIILDCEKQADVTSLLHDTRTSRLNDATLAVAVVAGQENIREMFSLGVNFVLYKPVSYDRALSSLRAAQSVLFRDKRRKARTQVHAHATIDYAGVEHARATLVDFAEDGMAVNFGKKLPPTCKVYFQFQLPGQTKSVRLSGQIVWQDWNGRAGIQFADVPQSSRRILREWLEVNLHNPPKHELATEQVEVEHSIRPTDENKLGGRGKKKEGTKAREAEIASEQHLNEPGNRRGEIRYTCHLGAEVYQQGSAVRNYCHLSDLSPGGCYLEMPLAFPAGAPVEIVVRTEEIKLRISGTVKASHPGYGMGVSFFLNTKDERAGVQQLIDFVAAAAAESS
jgi:CheY-like chemotaxis protein